MLLQQVDNTVYAAQKSPQQCISCLQAFRKTESVLQNNKQTLIADFADDKKVPVCHL